MPISASELQIFLSANDPVENDTDPVGGAIDLTGRLLDAQLASADQVEILSDGADTRDVTIRGRTASGALVEETETLNGTTPVVLSTTFRAGGIHTIEIDSGSSTRTVTIRRDGGGATVHTILPDEIHASALFLGAVAEASGGSPVTRYAKVFARNSNATLAHLGSSVELTADTADLYRIGLGSVGGTTATANRLATPGGITFQDDDVPIAVPGTDLAPEAAVEVWIEQTLAAGATPGTPSLEITMAGASI